VVEYSSRLVGDQNKLSTRFNDIVEILCESAAWAQIDGSSLVKAEHVNKAIRRRYTGQTSMIKAFGAFEGRYYNFGYRRRGSGTDKRPYRT